MSLIRIRMRCSDVETTDTHRSQEELRKTAVYHYFIDLISKEYSTLRHLTRNRGSDLHPAVTVTDEDNLEQYGEHASKKLKLLQTLHNDETSTSSSSMTVTPGTGSDPVCGVINEITSYMGPLRITIVEKLSPLLFWKRNERVYPKLSFLAKIFLTPNASSVPVEELFSVTGLIKNSRRTSIAPHKLSKLTFVHDNYGLYFPITK